MIEFSKALMLSLLANVINADAVAHRRESLAGKKFPIVEILMKPTKLIPPSPQEYGTCLAKGKNAVEGAIPTNALPCMEDCFVCCSEQFFV